MVPPNAEMSKATISYARDNYEITVNASPVTNETATSDNNFIHQWILITIQGDINAEKTVDIFDAIMLANNFDEIWV
jgi:hypothetical protein